MVSLELYVGFQFATFLCSMLPHPGIITNCSMIEPCYLTHQNDKMWLISPIGKVGNRKISIAS